MPIFTSVAKPIALTITAPRVAPIIGITSRSATTTASATAYSPSPTTNRKISDVMPAHSGDHERAGDVAADAVEDPVAEVGHPLAAAGRGQAVERRLDRVERGQEVERQHDDDERVASAARIARPTPSTPPNTLPAKSPLVT